MIEVKRGLDLPIAGAPEQRIEDAVALRLESELRALPGVREAVTAIGGRRCVAEGALVDAPLLPLPRKRRPWQTP